MSATTSSHTNMHDTAKRFLATQHPRMQHCLTDECVELSAQYAELFEPHDLECERMVDELDRWSI